MKKRSCLLLVIPVLCLMSCNKSTATRTIYRDNFTKRDVYFGSDLINSTTSTYDEYGLPIEVKQTFYPRPGVGSDIGEAETVITYSRAFDDKHREIRLEENVVNKNFYNPDTYTIVTREYDDSGFLTRENFKKLVYRHNNNYLEEASSYVKVAHKATTKDGYLIFTLQAGRDNPIFHNSSESKNPDYITTSSSIVSYDKQDRKTGTFSLSVTRSSLNSGTRAKYLSSSFVFANTNYQSDDNDTNDFYEYTYQRSNEEYNSKSAGEFIIESSTSGHETYSDKNLLIERHVDEITEKKIRLDNQEFSSVPSYVNTTDETWQYDDFNRLIFNESKKTAYDREGEKVGWDNLKLTYSYTNNDNQEPAKIISHEEAKNGDEDIITTDITKSFDFDDYGRVKTLSSEKIMEEKTAIKISKQIISDYANPIAIPEDEELISIPQTEVSLVHCDFIE
ncbi:MAG: hypothetical protein MJ208_02260 [Bacilli bacterium]|nr:hypothetical protein [Bacilli bacterium]